MFGFLYNVNLKKKKNSLSIVIIEYFFFQVLQFKPISVFYYTNYSFSKVLKY